MKNIKQRLNTKLILLFSVLLSLLVIPVSHAHMMVAQHGTLNVVDGGVFIVLSLPTSAFSGVDNDNDSKLSTAEFNQHRSDIAISVLQNVVLKNNNKKLTLQGLILSPVVSHSSPKSPSTQLVIMGRFTLNDPEYNLEFQVGLLGKNAQEKSLKITATDKAKSDKHVFTLTSKTQKVKFF